MGKPAARLTDMHTCPMVTPGVPPIPHVGGPILPPCVPNVLIGMLPAATVGDMCFCVGPPDAIAMGSPTVFIGGKMAARMGDPTMHGGVITLGCPTVLIGESGSGGAGGGVKPPPYPSQTDQSTQNTITDNGNGVNAKANSLVHISGTANETDRLLVVNELGKLSNKRLDALIEKNVKIYVVRDSVTEHWKELKGVKPRGWPEGKSWDDVPGGASGNTVVVATIGSEDKRRIPQRGEGHGSVSLVLHEVGHVFEDEGLKSAEFAKARQEDLNSLSDYYTQDGEAGMSETYAENFAYYYTDSSKMKKTHPGLFGYFNPLDPP